jgi:predicted nucleotidyltransferase
MNDRLENIVRQIIQLLQGTIDPQRLILFGSQATRQADDQSDLDLLIIAPSAERPLERRLRVRRLLREVDKAIGLDILFYTPEEVELFSQEPASFLCQILKTGITVYDRQTL